MPDRSVVIIIVSLTASVRAVGVGAVTVPRGDSKANGDGDRDGSPRASAPAIPARSVTRFGSWRARMIEVV
jgi:hypothetical protein